MNENGRDVGMWVTADFWGYLIDSQTDIWMVIKPIWTINFYEFDPKLRIFW